MVRGNMRGGMRGGRGGTFNKKASFSEYFKKPENFTPTKSAQISSLKNLNILSLFQFLVILLI